MPIKSWNVEIMLSSRAERSEVEGSWHWIDCKWERSAQILRLASLAQDDKDFTFFMAMTPYSTAYHIFCRFYLFQLLIRIVNSAKPFKHQFIGQQPIPAFCPTICCELLQVSLENFFRTIYTNHSNKRSIPISAAMGTMRVTSWRNGVCNPSCIVFQDCRMDCPQLPSAVFPVGKPWQVSP